MDRFKKKWLNLILSLTLMTGVAVTGIGQAAAAAPAPASKDIAGQRANPDVEKPAPLPPLNLRAMPGYHYVKLDWSAPVVHKDVQGYNVYVDDVKVNTELLTTTTFTKTGLSEDKEYRFTVRTVNHRGKESIKSSVNIRPVLTGTFPIQLLGVNDLHGKIDQTAYASVPNVTGNVYLGRMDVTAAYLREHEKQNPYTLMVEPGDLWGGSSPISALLQDEPTIEIFEALGFDVGTVGNHEFDEGTQEMMRMINGGEHSKGTKGYDGINFPIVAANVKYKATNENVLNPYVIKEVAGVKIGFIGVVTTTTPGIVMPEGIQDIYFTPEAEAVNQAVQELKQQGVKAIAVLAHMDAEQGTDGTITGPAAELAKTVDDEVDIIFAAHNHKVVNGLVDNKLIVQAFEYGKAFADIDAVLDPTTGDFVSMQGEVVYTDQSKVTPDPQIAAILSKYEEILQDRLNEVVGETTEAFNRAYDPKTGDYTSGYVNNGDHHLGNLIADGMRAAMNSDFALMNGGGIRDNLNAGPVTWNELFNIQPFGNTLVKLQVTGAQFKEIMNGQISIYGADYSVSGFKYKWDTGTRKVVSLTLPNGSEIDPIGNYTVTINNFMATSKPATNLFMKYGVNVVNGPEDITATVNFVKNYGKPLSTADFATGRITMTSGTTPDLGKVSVQTLRGAAVGSQATIEGIVTADNSAIGGSQLNTFLQDATAGINIYKSSIGTFPNLKEGDRIESKGTLKSYKGLLEFEPISITVISSGQALPVPKVITLAQLQMASTAEPLEGQLVKTTVFTQSIPDTPAGGGYNVAVVDSEFNGTTLRVMEATGIHAGLQANKWYDVTGILGQYDSYQLIPRKISDVLLSAVQPEAPKPAPSYSSSVASVTDGDTIHLLTPVLGADKVRFVNIDTPETYHITDPAFDASLAYPGTDNESKDKNQKAHGERAKAALNALLPVGTEVEVKIGATPFDDYGRLLAQIIRKNDGMNVNLEMVKQGYAVTYFIWPVQDSDFVLYSNTMKDTMQVQAGIWNPADPLTELPFEFRAREQNKGFSRYVGNYATKKYVDPASWSLVPVEQRLFFNTEDEAKQQGYTFMESPISNFALQGSPTADGAAFTFSAPTGASVVQMVYMNVTANSGWMNITPQEALTANSVMASVYGLLPGTSYKFKLIVTGGTRAGESNEVAFDTLAGHTPLLFEKFESGIKGSYTAADVTLDSGSWNLNNALIGNLSADKKNDLWSVRFKAPGSLTMNFNVPEAKSVSVYHAFYGTETGTIWSLEKSTDNGVTWTDVSGPITPTATLEEKTITVNETGPVRFRIVVSGIAGKRMNIDDVKILN